jgi:hypothetical protein
VGIKAEVPTLYSPKRAGLPGHPGRPTLPGHPGWVEGWGSKPKSPPSTRRSEQAFLDIQVGQPFQDILVGLRWWFERKGLRSPIGRRVTLLIRASRPLTHVSRPLTRALGPLTHALGPLTRASRPLTHALGPLTRASGPLTRASLMQPSLGFSYKI